MNFISTRNTQSETYSSAEVIKRGIAPDGGLFVPVELPKLTEVEITALAGMNYNERASYILGLFLTDYTKEELDTAAKSAYSRSKFGTPPVRLTKLDNNYMLELWHGPTSAFKDMALQIMPHLLSMSLTKTGESKDALILVATSGDTGKAALEGFADVDRVKILVFYPVDGVSDIQKRQMQTQSGKNVSVCAIRGNFDDAQSGVKDIFADAAVAKAISEKGCFFSSANSINFGRLAPQIVYYISAYCTLMAEKQLSFGERLDVTVPTGNFGNILAAYIAKKMGLPLGRLVCASNSNNVLTDFFKTGVYDRNRRFYTTVSPSMDILISSNLERLLYFTAGPEKTAFYMKELRETGRFSVDSEVKAIIDRDFCGAFCNEEETLSTIAETFRQYNYLCDTHTAVALYAANRYVSDTGGAHKMLTVSTASPYKFAPAVAKALGLKADGDEFLAAEAVSRLTGTVMPKNLRSLKDKKVIFDRTVDKTELVDVVLDFIK